MMEYWATKVIQSIKISTIMYLFAMFCTPTFARLKILVKDTNNLGLHTRSTLLRTNHSASYETKHDYPKDWSLQYIYQTTCEYNNVKYPAGEFHLPNCVICYCNDTTAKVTCKVKDCKPIENCVSYETMDSNKLHKDSSDCCPKCREYGCVYNGTLYKAGEKIKKTDCTKCYCPWEANQEGVREPKCLTIQCNSPRCVDGVVPEGMCCPVCPNGPNCYLEDQIIAEGERIYVDGCKYCYCKKEMASNTLSNVTKPRTATCERSFFCI